MYKETTVMGLFFNTELGYTLKISIHDPDTSLLPSEVETAMNDMIETGILVGKGGFATAALSAQVVTRSVSEIYDNEN